MGLRSGRSSSLIGNRSAFSGISSHASRTRCRNSARRLSGIPHSESRTKEVTRTSAANRKIAPRSSRLRGVPTGIPGLVRNNGAHVMRPVRFPTPSSSLSGFDRAPAAYADLPGGVREVIFPGWSIAFGEVGIREPPALAHDKALLGYGHVHSLTGPPARIGKWYYDLHHSIGQLRQHSSCFALRPLSSTAITVHEAYSQS